MTTAAHDSTVTPTLDVPLDEAVAGLTGWETLEIEKHYKGTIDTLGAIKLTIGTVHAYENRDGNRRSWQSVEAMTLRELQGYFAQPPKEPDGELGKDSPAPPHQIGDSPNGASEPDSRLTSTTA